MLVLIFESVDVILKRDHSNESYSKQFSVVLIIILYKVVVFFESVEEMNESN